MCSPPAPYVSVLPSGCWTEDVPSGLPVTMLPSGSAAAWPPPPVSVAGMTVPSGIVTVAPAGPCVINGPSATGAVGGGVSVGAGGVSLTGESVGGPPASSQACRPEPCLRRRPRRRVEACPARRFGADPFASRHLTWPSIEHQGEARSTTGPTPRTRRPFTPGRTAAAGEMKHEHDECTRPCLLAPRDPGGLVREVRTALSSLSQTCCPEIRSERVGASLGHELRHGMDVGMTLQR